MKKIVILGCENTHAGAFLQEIKANYSQEIEVVGIYSDEAEPMERLSKEYSVKQMATFDEAVGKVDGVIVTARHGDNHLKYALPYMKKGVKLFMDKPITCSEKDAIKMGKLFVKYGAFVTGGSSLKVEKHVVQIKKQANSGNFGKILGGFIRTPVNLNNPYGGFYFYAPHLVEIVGEIFGRYPTSVTAKQVGSVVTAEFNYDGYSVTGEFVDGNYLYHATVSTEKKVFTTDLDVGGYCYKEEFKRFYKVLNGKQCETNYKDFISPVFVINALVRSLNSNKTEKVREFSL